MKHDKYDQFEMYDTVGQLLALMTHQFQPEFRSSAKGRVDFIDKVGRNFPSCLK